MKQTASLKKAQGEYRKNRKRLEIIFSPSEKELYVKLVKYAEKENVFVNNAVKTALAEMLH